jgi:hypothetical protein
MRRLVVVAVMLVFAATLVACSSGAAPDETATPVPASGEGAEQPAATAPDANADVLSPLPDGAGIPFPTDASSVPQDILANVTTGKPVIVFWYDPTTYVSKDQRTEIDAAMKKYTGSITLFALDYTLGVPTSSSPTTLPAEVDKAERLAGLLKVSTTPYIVFVNSSGTITFRFAGFVDRVLIRREIMRATQ